MIIHIVGTRPNFMKLAPVWRALADQGVKQLVVHTGQHYDLRMSDIFFEQLQLPSPDINLGIGSHSPSRQTALLVEALETVFIDHSPKSVVVYGDVTSSAAAALTASKLFIPVVHVEAGLRSFDRSMPEELNRLVIDQLSSLLLTPSVDADRNLAREGIPDERIRFVGNVMIDSLVKALPHVVAPPYEHRFVLVTLHRPSNVDDPTHLLELIDAVETIAGFIEVVFSVHPRTEAMLRRIGRSIENIPGLTALPPQGYLEFLGLQNSATAVVTDSGGIQEETTFLGTPCFTMRPNTERPITVEMGTNTLLGNDCQRLIRELRHLPNDPKSPEVPPLWDGQAGRRIARAMGTFNLL